MRAAVHVEWLKLRRSPVTLTATALLVVLLPLMGLGFYSVALRGGTGLMSLKAEALFDGEGWGGYLGAVDQIAAVAVFLGAGIVVAWAFGREHADRTFSSLFALPVGRGSIAVAKYVVLIGWITLLSLLVVLVAFVLGVVAGVGDLAGQEVASELLRLLAVTYSAGLLSFAVGLAASLGRGYLPAIGTLIVIIATAQVAVLFGTGGWFPFAVPGLIAVAGSEGAPALGAVHIGSIPVTAALGIWLTVRWWRRAEVV